MISCVWLFVTPWAIAHQAPLSMEISWQEYRIGLPFPTSGYLSDSTLNPRLLHLLHWQEYTLPLNHLDSPLLSKRSQSERLYTIWYSGKGKLLWKQWKDQKLPGATGRERWWGRTQRIFKAGTLLCMKVQWWIRHYTFVTPHRIHLMKSEPGRYTMDSGWGWYVREGSSA